MADLVSYDPQVMRQTAQQIKNHVQQTQQRYENSWRNAEAFIARFPGFMQPFVRNIFAPHDQHYRDSYQWQLDFADRLSATADAIEATDAQVVKIIDNQR